MNNMLRIFLKNGPKDLLSCELTQVILNVNRLGEVLKKRMFAYDASKQIKGESAYCSKPKTHLILPDDHCIANRSLTKLIITDNCNE